MTKDYELQPHEIRVVDEKKELDTKILNLQKWIFDNPKYKELSEKERNLQRNQLDAMERYSFILGQRIDCFGQ